MILSPAVKDSWIKASRDSGGSFKKACVCKCVSVSYHHDICAEGFSESHAHTLILEPSSGSASSGSPLLRDAQFHRFCHFLHYSFLCSGPPLDGWAEYVLQLKSKQRSHPDKFMRSLPCDQSPHFSLSPAPFLPPLFNCVASLTFHCLSLSLPLRPSHIPIGTR